MLRKTIRLSFITLMACSKLAFAQTPSATIQELQLPLPLLQPDETVKKLNTQFISCGFLSNPDPALLLSNSFTAPMTLECNLYADKEMLADKSYAHQTVGRFYTDLGTNHLYSQARILITEPLIHQFLRRYDNTEALLYQTDPWVKQQARLTLLDKMSRPVWQYNPEAPAAVLISQLNVDALTIGAHYVVAYYDPANSVELLQNSGEVGFQSTQISVLMDQLDKDGKRTNTQKVMIDIQPDTRVIINGDDEHTIRLWRVKQDQYALSIYSGALDAKSKIQGSYKVIFFKADGSVDHQAQINLEKQAAGGSRKFLIDTEGNMLLLSYNGKGVEAWQSGFQAELAKYDKNGKVLWRKVILPAKPPAGKAACLSWDLQETRQQQYFMVCEQRTYVKGEWQHDDVYHQLMGVLINQKGQEVWRTPLLNGPAMQGLYEVDEYGEWPAQLQISLFQDKAWVNVSGGSKTLPYEEWKKIVASDKNPLLGKYLGVHLYEITLPKP